MATGTLADESVAERLSGSAIGDREGDQLMDTSQGRVFVFNLEAQRPEMYRALLGDWAADALRACRAAGTRETGGEGGLSQVLVARVDQVLRELRERHDGGESNGMHSRRQRGMHKK